MDSEERLERNLCIAFEGCLSSEEKKALILTDRSIDDIFAQIKRIPKIQDSRQVIKWLENGLGKALWYGEEEFPEYSGIEKHVPYVLFYKGKKPTLCPSLTIVGTRYATEDALQRAFTLGLEAGINKIRTVSGIAQGTDQAALRGALSAFTTGYGAPVIAVLGCGLEVDYPTLSKPLKERIIELGGTLISQFPPYTPGLKQNFPSRNLTLAALSTATIVVQAPEKSGSLITSDFALQMGRDVLVSDIGINAGAKNDGTAKLHQEGAPVVRSLSDYFQLELMAAETKKLIKPFARYGDRNYTVIKTC